MLIGQAPIVSGKNWAHQHAGKHRSFKQDCINFCERLPDVRQRNCTSSLFQVEKIFRDSVHKLLAALVQQKVDNHEDSESVFKNSFYKARSSSLSLAEKCFMELQIYLQLIVCARISITVLSRTLQDSNRVK